MKIKTLEEILKMQGYYCPRLWCKSKDTESIDSMTTNISLTTAETRRCKKCGHIWVRYYEGF